METVSKIIEITVLVVAGAAVVGVLLLTCKLANLPSIILLASISFFRRSEYGLSIFSGLVTNFTTHIIILNTATPPAIYTSSSIM